MIRIFSQYVSPKSVLLMIIEGILMVVALLCGAWLRFWNSPSEFSAYTKPPDFLLQSLVFVVVFQICFYYSDLYNLNAIRHRNEQLIGLGQSVGSGCLLLGIAYYIFPRLLIGRGVFFISTGLVVTFVVVSRLLLETAWHVAAPKQNVLILGTRDLAVNVARELKRRDDLNIRLVGFVDPAPRGGVPGDLFGNEVLGSAENLEAIATENRISRIVVALEDRRGTLPVRELVRLRVQGVRVEDAHSTIAALSGRVWLQTVRPSWFVFSEGFHRARVTLALKRMLDLACGIVGLVASFPVMLLVGLCVRLESKGPVIYRQTRVGLGGRGFELLKFRSMRADAEQGGAVWAQKNDTRVTRIGSFLRKYRFDELPQFLNVIRGEMSFVGPRPERPVFVEQLRQQISYYDERHSVRPGLTGWAQVQYEYGSSVEDAYRKLEYDLFYLKNMSILFDVAIVIRTIGIVLTGRGGR